MKLNALFLAGDEFPPLPGGTGTVVYYAAGNLRANRIAVLSNVRDAASSGNYTARYCPLFSARPQLSQMLSAARLILWAKFIFRPNLIVVGSLWYGNVGLLLKRYLRVPMLLYAHGTELLRLDSYRWNKPRRVIEEADMILPNSRYTRGLLLGLGVDPSKIEIIHHAADPSVFFPLPESRIAALKKRYGLDDLRIILTVANLQRHKGQDMVIKALPAIRNKFPNAVYCVVGKGRDDGYLRALAGDVGVGGSVRFFSNLKSRDELRDFYNMSDVFIMPSRMIPERKDVEGFGIAYLEANACGKPVIGGRSGGVPDAVEEGVTGLLVSPENADEIAEGVVKILGNPELGRRLGEKGRERVIRELNWKNRAERLREVCDRVLDKRQRAGERGSGGRK